MGDDYGGGLGYTYTAESEASTPLLDAGNDRYVSNAEESDTPTFCQRFGSSCVGLLVGCAVVALSIPLLWGNEERYIQTWRVLDEASRLVVEAPCDDVAKERFGALVHVSCNLEVGGHPAIDSLGVVAKGAAVLVREGEMYQWEENVKEYEREDHSGHRKTVKEYSYYRVWRDSPIDSSLFRYPDQCITRSSRLAPCFNPPWPEDLEGPNMHWAGVVNAGIFRLTLGLRNTIPADQPFRPPLPLYYGSDGITVYNRTGYSLTTVQDGQDATAGDVRIHYKVNSAEVVSILGAQAYSPNANVTFSAFTTPKGRLFMPQLFVGEVSAGEMFRDLNHQNEMLTWLVRLGGWVMCWLGLGLCTQPLVLLTSWVPLLGGCMGDVVFCTLCCAAGVLSLSMSTSVVAIAWLFYRPAYAIPMLVAAAALLLYLLCMRGRRHPAGPDHTMYPNNPPAAAGPYSQWPPTAYPSADGGYPYPPYPTPPTSSTSGPGYGQPGWQQAQSQQPGPYPLYDGGGSSSSGYPPRPPVGPSHGFSWQQTSQSQQASAPPYLPAI